MDAPLFTRRFHVNMSDIDGLGVLFYATPLFWAERLMCDWRRTAWLTLSEMLATGLATPVVHTEIFYTRPLRLDDEVEGTIRFVGRSERSFTLSIAFASVTDGGPAVEVRIKQVFVRLADGMMGPATIPAEFVAVLESGSQGDADGGPLSRGARASFPGSRPAASR
jgi:acyl-CoA thioesterase FadM